MVAPRMAVQTGSTSAHVRSSVIFGLSLVAWLVVIVGLAAIGMLIWLAVALVQMFN